MSYLNEEVSDAVLAALVIHDNRNCGDQFDCGFDLAQTVQLQFAQLCWRCHRRSDSGTFLGAVEAQEVEEDQPYYTRKMRGARDFWTGVN